MNMSLSHIAIAVPSLELAAERLRNVYGLKVGPFLINSAQGVRMVYVELAGGGCIELLEPLTQDSGIARFLVKHPTGGVHHISLSTPDIDATLQSLLSNDVAVLDGGQSTNVHGERIAFVHPRDFFGVLIELEERREVHE